MSASASAPVPAAKEDANPEATDDEAPAAPSDGDKYATSDTLGASVAANPSAVAAVAADAADVFGALDTADAADAADPKHIPAAEEAQSPVSPPKQRPAVEDEHGPMPNGESVPDKSPDAKVASFADGGPTSDPAAPLSTPPKAAGEREASQPDDAQPSRRGGDGRSSRSGGVSSRHSSRTYTASPTGRFHPDRIRRLQLRGCDPHCNINYFAPHGAPDNDGKMKESSFVAGQAFIESLRHYPRGGHSVPREQLAWTECETHDSEATYSGRPTTRASVFNTEHIESDVRARLGIGAAAPDWRPTQVHAAWGPERNTSVARHMELYHARRLASGGVSQVIETQDGGRRTQRSGGVRQYPTKAPERPRRDFSILAKPSGFAVPMFNPSSSPTPGGRPPRPPKSRINFFTNAFGQAEAREEARVARVRVRRRPEPKVRAQKARDTSTEVRL